MALPPNFDEPALNTARRLDEAVDRGQANVFRVLWFWLPSGSVARDRQFQQLLASRFLTDIALQALLYGALIVTARSGGGAIDAALLGSAYMLPGVLLGLFGGIVADALPKRVALAGAYLLMGAIALAVPVALGTGFRAMLLVLFGVRVLHQVSQPSEASAVPLVATSDELASATSFMGLASSAGEVVGKAVLAPVIVRAFGVNPVTVVAGLLFIFSASRVFDLRPPRHPGPLAGARPIPTRLVVAWLIGQRTMLWMLLLAALASTSGVVLGVLGPQYTREVLGVDPSFALYVFAPAALGLLAGLAVSPLAIRLIGERPVTLLGLVLLAITMAALGIVDVLEQRLTWLPVLDLPRVERKVELAAQLSIVLGLSMTLAATAVQTYIARRIPLHIQGRTFALLGVMKDGMAIVALLVLGVAADFVSVGVVITLSPLLLLALALGIDRAARRWRPGL